MSRFKVGDRVVLEGVIERIEPQASTAYPFFVRFTDSDSVWIGDVPCIHHARHDIGLLPMQLEAVTKERDEARARIEYLESTENDDMTALRKERDDAREQLARVCAQVETLGAELKRERSVAEDLRGALVDASKRAGQLRDERNEALATLAGCSASKRDTRILDCVETLLGLRGGER